MAEYITSWLDPRTDMAHVKEEIVRCRDCAKLDRSNESERCAGWYWCPSTSRHTPPDGFCVWGEAFD